MKFKNAFRFTENTDTMIAFWDKYQICRFANSAYVKWFGVKPEELIDKVTLSELLGPLYEKNLPYINKALKGEMQIFERELTQIDGKVRNTLATYSPEFHRGEVSGFFVHVVDITFIKPLNSTIDDSHSSFKDKIEKDARLSKVEQILQSSLLTGFPGIENLAKGNYISPTKLKKDFRARYKLPIFSYYRKLQMQIADKYLKEKIYSKKQISELFDFANQTNFITCYNKYITNESPDKLDESK